jgi:outer membrane immunogenic protein
MSSRNLLFSSVALAAMIASASAADLPSTKEGPAYVPPPPAAFSWTGFYFGGQVGYEWGQDTTTQYMPDGVPDGFVQGFNTGGVNGGGHVGYDYQINQFVLGIEGDLNGAGNSGSFAVPGPAGENVRDNVEGAILGRVGVTFDRVLFYVQGGGTLANFHYSYYAPASAAAPTDLLGGWTVGGGVEYAIDPNWSVFADYRYSDYGSVGNYWVPDTQRQQPRENLAQVGFSYKFDFAPPPASVVAKY